MPSIGVEFVNENLNLSGFARPIQAFEDNEAAPRDHLDWYRFAFTRWPVDRFDSSCSTRLADCFGLY